MLTYGFYDSFNGDRRYNAFQMSSIFDGIIKDGVYMSIGDRFKVTPMDLGTTNPRFGIYVGTGRCWFNHTWTYNNSPIHVYLDQEHGLQERIDAIVIDINQHYQNRENSIKVVKGTPSSTPEKPTLIHDDYNEHYQYAIAYVKIQPGKAYIDTVDIENVVGKSETPYVTGIFEAASIDSLTDQWQAQWDTFYESQTAEMIDMTADYRADMNQTANKWKNEWRNYYEKQTSEIESWTDNYKAGLQTFYDTETAEFETWSNNYKNEFKKFYESQTATIENWTADYETMMNQTAEGWKAQWNQWFNNYTNESQQQFASWMGARDSEYTAWFNNLQVTLDGNVAANLANRIVKLESCCETVKDFINNLESSQIIYDELSDNSSETILDGSGNTITTKVIFTVK